jgi:MarR family transcriptional regulator for hemolysin
MSQIASYEFNGNFLYYVRLVKKLMECYLEEAASSCGLSWPEADVLSFLRENPEFDTARDIAIYREVSKGYVSKAVDALSKKGYLSCVQDSYDRRLQHLAITEKASSAAETLHEAQFRFYAALTRDIPLGEVNAMLKTITKCASNVQRAVKEYPWGTKP